MTEYLILSKYFSTEKPAYALVDDKKYPDQVVCYTGDPGNKGHWKVIPEGPPGSSTCRLELADDTDHRRAQEDRKTKNVVVGKPGELLVISPPLCQGGPETPRSISTAINTLLHISEWAIHGKPEERGIPDSLVRIDTRTFNTAPDPKTLWYIQEVRRA